MIHWEQLAVRLEALGIRTGNQLDVGLRENGLSLEELDVEYFVERDDLSKMLRQGQRYERWPLLLPILYVLSLFLYPDSHLEELGVGWLQYLRFLLLAGLGGPLFLGRPHRRLARVVENYLDLDALRRANL